jgi:riboflavin synthase
MFTGIVEERGVVDGLERLADSARLTLRAPLVVSDAVHGASIAVNGVCLTVIRHDDQTFSADVMAETLERTALGSLAAGDPVNLERAVRADARLGGHIVQGHVDGIGHIVGRTPSAHWTVIRIAVPADLAKWIVEKGSITVDGVSLTVSAVTGPGAPDAWFEVSLIPATQALTTFGVRDVGDAVNLEVDVIAKHVDRLLAWRNA